MDPAVPLQSPAPSSSTVEIAPIRAGHAVFRHAFVPALLTATVVAWSQRTALEGWLQSAGVGLDFISALVLAALVAISCAEQLYPAHRAWNYNLLSGDLRGWGTLGRDLLYLLVVTQLSAVTLRGARWLLDTGLTRLGLHPLAVWPTGAPMPVRIALAFLGVELGSYWLHRAAHRFRPLWQFHSTHHVIEELTGMKALRTHPVDNAFFFLARTAPLLLLGAGPEELLGATVLGSILGLLAHANLDVTEGPLGAVINFPRFHAVHHSAARAESQSNFGCHTVLWDRIFGTFRRGSGARDGVPAPLGVEPRGPRTLWQELVWPFYRRVS